MRAGRHPSTPQLNSILLANRLLSPAPGRICWENRLVLRRKGYQQTPPNCLHSLPLTRNTPRESRYQYQLHPEVKSSLDTFSKFFQAALGGRVQHP
jgi:hypothetical protein